MGNIIVGQSGGPTAVINASLAGIIDAGNKIENTKMYGMINGIQGLLQRHYIEIEMKSSLDLELLKRTPSAYLGSCRYKLPMSQDDEQVYIKIFDILKELSIDKFFYIGGNDSMDTIKKLNTYAIENGKNVSFIGVPKTIDNDLAITDHTPGFGSACKYIATSIKEIIKDATAYNAKNITIIEIMGRNTGWLTGAAGLTKSDDCNGIDLIYFPEVTFDVDKFVQTVEKLQQIKKSIVIAISEGIKDKNGKNICELKYENTLLDCFGHKSLSGTATMLANILCEKLHCKTRAIELNTVQRCASHIMSETDMKESFLAGAYAVKIALLQKSGRVIIFKRIDEPYRMELSDHDVCDIANVEKLVPIEWIDQKNANIHKEFINYIRPLIQGEVYPMMVDGLPKHLKLKEHKFYK